MILSAAHRPLNPPFRRAPGANVRRDEVGEGICRGVFGYLFAEKRYKTPATSSRLSRYFWHQKVQSTPQAKTAVVLLPLQAIMRRFKTRFQRRGRDSARTCEHVRMFACSQSRIYSSQNAKCRFSPHLALTITFHYTHYMGECPL